MKALHIVLGLLLAAPGTAFCGGPAAAGGPSGETVALRPAAVGISAAPTSCGGQNDGDRGRFYGAKARPDGNRGRTAVAGAIGGLARCPAVSEQTGRGHRRQPATVYLWPEGRIPAVTVIPRIRTTQRIRQ